MAATVVLSRRDVERFTPESYGDKPDAPVYLIAPLTWRERGQFNGSVGRAGLVWRSDDDVLAAVRAAVEEVGPDNAAELLGAVDAFRDALATRNATAGDPSAPPDDAEPGPDDADAKPKRRRAKEKDDADAAFEKVRLAYAGIEEAMRRHPTVAALMGDRAEFNLVAPGIAASYALRGWENVAVQYRRVAGVVPDDVLSLLPPDDLAAVGWRALALMRPGDATRGN